MMPTALSLLDLHNSVQVLDLEEEGKLNMTVRLKKRALQGAYDQAIKKKKVCARLERGSHAFVDVHAACAVALSLESGV